MYSIADGWNRLLADCRQDFQHASDVIKDLESRLGRASGVYGSLHSDSSFRNMLFDRVKAKPIDFDDCGYGYY
jgi:Ser/Thr protein kinase RdoA (MazF antagonist)